MTGNHGLRALATGLLGGCVGTLLVGMLLWHNRALQARYHWWKVESYLRHLKSAQSSSGIEDPFDVMPSLAALVSLEELDYVDLVFPDVSPTDEVTRDLQLYFRRSQGIVFMEFNPEFGEIQPSGQQPLHLQLWFRKRGHDEVRRLIQRIEDTASQRRKETDE